MNSLTIIGNLTSDPVERVTKSGKRLADFKVATNEKRGDRENTTYFHCKAWDRLTDPILKYLHKGSKVAIEGRVSAHAYTDKNGEAKAEIDVDVNRFEFCDSKPDRGDAYDDDVKYDPKSGLTAVADDGLPF